MKKRTYSYRVNYSLDVRTRNEVTTHSYWKEFDDFHDAYTYFNYVSCTDIRALEYAGVEGCRAFVEIVQIKPYKLLQIKWYVSKDRGGDKVWR